MLSQATFIKGDPQRLKGVQERVSSCPLGVGALASNPLGIGREFMAKDLGFQAVHPNSLCAVAGRDFVVDILWWESLLMAHLGPLAEDLILFSPTESGFVQVADAYSTGRSLMPQKKNPDSLEGGPGNGPGMLLCFTPQASQTDMLTAPGFRLPRLSQEPADPI